MMVDRYTKSMLTVIAGALLYLAVIFTPLPGASAQAPTLRPGESSGPTQVVVVGWQTSQSVVPVSISQPVEVTATRPLPVTGQVKTDRASDRADRVILVGWEERANREAGRGMETFETEIPSRGGLPVRLPK
jgi:hypothetical protein